MEKKKMAAIRLSRAAVAAGLALGLSALGAPLALAHDAVVGATPADNETVQEFPDTLTIDFSGEVQQDFNTLTLSHGESDEVVFSGEPDVEGTAVSLTLPEDFEATPGSYRIGYQIVSSDGHPTKGVTNFTYEPVATGATSATSASSAAEATTEAGENTDEMEASEGASDESSDESSDEGFAMWLWGLLAGLLVGGAVALALFVFKNRTPKNHPDSPTTPANKS